jgi:hypothetical protein
VKISFPFFPPEREREREREIFHFVNDLPFCVDLKLDGKWRGLCNGCGCMVDVVWRKKLLEWV